VTPRFDDAWAHARQIAEEATSDGFDLVLLRDLLGRASIIVEDNTTGPYPAEIRKRIGAALTRRCAPFVSPEPVLLVSELFSPAALIGGPDLLEITPRDEAAGIGRLAVLERGVVGREWGQVHEHPAVNWVTLYGFKGGVGRSTATVVLARHLAALGKCVLIADLDLESPGVSSVALAPEDMPDYGLVDYLVEAGVDNAAGLECVGRSSRLLVSGNGEVWIAPAGGRARVGYTYAPKLNRAYLDLPGVIEAQTPTGGPSTGEATFARRLRRAIAHCVAEVTRQSRDPDVVLLDSRAGIHDVAAIAISQLSDLSLLFATDNAQTWNGYRELFQQWRGNPELTRRIRERLKMVATMVPASHEDQYIATFQDKAQLMFSEQLYDEADADDDDAFNPPLGDVAAPHFPLPILFTSDLVGMDLTAGTAWLDQDFVNTAYAHFVQGAAALILQEPGAQP
jgi:hypothetical protein